MNDVNTHEWVRAAIDIAGALSIYLGYRLFCDVSSQKTRSTLLTNLASGALLALFGLGILVADARGIGNAPAPTPTRQKSPTREGSFESPRLGSHAPPPEHLV